MGLMDLKLPPGLDRGATPYESPNRWWDCNLVRWQDGIIRPIGGWDRNTAAPLSEAARDIHIWRDNVGSRRVLIGTDSHLIEEVSGVYTDKTPSGFNGAATSGPRGGYGTFAYGSYDYGTNTGTEPRPPSTIYTSFFYWTQSNWGEDVMSMANSDGNLFHYVATSPPTPNPENRSAIGSSPTGPAPKGVACIVTAQRHVMIIGAVGGTLGGGVGGPRMVAWCSQEDYTDWNFSSTSNTAGYLNLASDAILQVPYNVREGVLIFTQAEVFLARYVGLPFIYGFDRLADISLLSPKAVGVFNGQAAWMGKQGFWLYSGGIVNPLPCSIGNDIFAFIDPVYGPYRAFACENGVFPEVWFFYPEIGHTECNKCVIFNHQERVWYWANLSRTAMASAGPYRYPIAGGPDKNIYTHESGYLDAGAPRVGSVWIESSAIGIGDGSRTMEVSQLMLGTGTGYDRLQVTGYGHMTQEGHERTFGPYSPRANGYTDVRMSGRDIRFRFTATHDEEWAVGRARIEATQGTGR